MITINMAGRAIRRALSALTAERAAVVTFELLNELDCSRFIIAEMDAKSLTNEICHLLFPLPESIKKVGTDFANVTNRALPEIWK